MSNTVTIDCFPESARKYRREYAVVAVDVIRATTMAVTSAALGRRCFPVPTLEEARLLAGVLPDAVVAGELGGDMPEGFAMTNSPVELSERRDIARPLVLLSSSGTKLIAASGNADASYLACFRNYRAVAEHIAGAHEHVAVIGAGSRGEFREEDQMCCAWIAELLMEAGYEPRGDQTEEVVERWRGAPVEACRHGNSAKYLARSGYLKDLEFILEHVSDLDDAFRMDGGEVVRASGQPVPQFHEAYG